MAEAQRDRDPGLPGKGLQLLHRRLFVGKKSRKDAILRELETQDCIGVEAKLDDVPVFQAGEQSWYLPGDVVAAINIIFQDQQVSAAALGFAPQCAVRGGTAQASAREARGIRGDEPVLHTLIVIQASAVDRV